MTCGIQICVTLFSNFNAARRMKRSLSLSLSHTHTQSDTHTHDTHRLTSIRVLAFTMLINLYYIKRKTGATHVSCRCKLTQIFVKRGKCRCKLTQNFVTCHAASISIIQVSRGKCRGTFALVSFGMTVIQPHGLRY